MAKNGGPAEMQGQRKTKTGRVVSDKMDKTIVVSVERLTRHRLYKRVIRLTTKFKAHDEANDAHVGDTVLIEESRPLSATKRWRLVEVVQRSGDHGGVAELVGEEAAVSEAIHAAAHPGRKSHDDAADDDAAKDGDA
jgi:small subunit ribosomal protein S17